MTIPNEYRDMFSVKRIEVVEIGGKPAKETYKQCPILGKGLTMK
jgi:hypothetical protein